MSPARLLAALAAGLSATGAGWLLLRDQTTDSDHTGEDVGRIDIPTGAQSLGARAVEVLSRHVGEHGQGKKGAPGYHRSPFIDRVNAGLYNDAPGLIGGPWCARACRYAFEVAAQELGLRPPFARIRSDLASISKWKKYLGVHRISAPKVGAVLLLGDTHATLIARVIDERNAVCIEGNHRDAVANVKRKIDPSKDTLIDAEAYASAGAVRGVPLVGGLDLFGAAQPA